MVSLNAMYEHRSRWNRLVARIFDALPFLGIDDHEARITGDPYVLQIGSWATLSLIETATGPHALIRTDKPPGLTSSIDLKASDEAVIRDVVDVLDAAVRRRRRHVDGEQQAKEAELHGMVTDLGLICQQTGGMPLRAEFRDNYGTLRGSLDRIETRSDRPDQARFGITLNLAPMTYADALRVLQSARDLAAQTAKTDPVPGMEPPQEPCAAGCWL
jgi:hypothetical protein